MNKEKITEEDIKYLEEVPGTFEKLFWNIGMHKAEAKARAWRHRMVEEGRYEHALKVRRVTWWTVMIIGLIAVLAITCFAPE